MIRKAIGGSLTLCCGRSSTSNGATPSARVPLTDTMKADGKLDRNWLKGALGDAIHAVLCGAGYNLRMILRKLRLLYAFVIAALFNLSIAADLTA
jgi:IS5 family transposase